MGQPPAFVVRVLSAARHYRVAEESKSFLEKGVGGSRSLVACALAVKGPRKSRVATRPSFTREARRPLGHERGLALAAEPEEGEDARVGRLRIANLCPGVQSIVAGKQRAAIAIAT